jgi:hypothetical protein
MSTSQGELGAVVRGASAPRRKCSPQIHDIERKANSSMLAQLMPMSGGLASSQSPSSSTIRWP